MSALAEKIREARKAMGFTQVKLAKKIGVSFQHLSMWERGIISPSHKNLVKIAEVCKVSLDWLLTEKGPSRKKLIKTAELPPQYRGIELSPEDLELLDKLNKKPELKNLIKATLSANKRAEGAAKELVKVLDIPFEVALALVVGKGIKK